MSGEQRLVVRVSDAHGHPLHLSGLARWLRRVAPRRAKGIVGVALVSDRTVRELNRKYRRRNVPTDVLSFPAALETRGSTLTADGRKLTARATFLGDVVIARGVARRQARSAGHDAATELRVLALHGLLHLMGYDHERDNGRMLRLERRLRRKGGLGEGLIERADADGNKGRR